MKQEHQQSPPLQLSSNPFSITTLCNLIDTIKFQKKPKYTSTVTMNQRDSKNISAINQSKEKSKLWTSEQDELFHLLLKKYGTDFHILSSFFPKKTKNQLKNRYKHYMSLSNTREKEAMDNSNSVGLFLQSDDKSQKKECSRDENQ